MLSASAKPQSKTGEWEDIFKVYSAWQKVRAQAPRDPEITLRDSLHHPGVFDFWLDRESNA